ncbi:MAG: serpin family protein [Firmicutes bacterium]|nr:serpin family protein [Bacillota bacterium]
MTKRLKNNFKKILILGVSAILMAVLMLGCTIILPSDSPSDSPTHTPPICGSFMPGATGNLMDGITARSVNATTLSDKFITSTANFSIDLFRQSLQQDENTLISATSVLLALAMTANGARGNTLSQIEQVLGGGLPMAQLNRYLHSFTNGLFSGEKSQLDIANSIWFRDHGLFVEPEFLQINADYFGANAYSAPFDQTTIDDINAWVYYHTDGMIEEILEEIRPSTVMFLINAIMFDAEWERVYYESDIGVGIFTTFDGREQTTTFMTSGGHHGAERYFIQDDSATGFIKPYYGGYYSFVALLPNEDVCLMDYVAGLTGEGFVNTIQNVQNLSVFARLPKFEFDFDLTMNDELITLGIEDAFCDSNANFSGIGHSPLGNLFIAEVSHNTFISVNERGTRAGAVTRVDMDGESAPMFDRYVILNRPFVFAIIDNSTSLPIFMGTLLEV